MENPYIDEERNFSMHFSEETKAIRSKSKDKSNEINDLFMHLSTAIKFNSKRMKRFETCEDPNGLEEQNNINGFYFLILFKRLFFRDHISENLRHWRRSLE